MKSIIPLLFIFISFHSFCQVDINNPVLGDNVVDGVIVNSEYRFNSEFVVSKNNKSTYIIQSNRSNIVGITGISNQIGQYIYNQVIVDPNYESFVYLDSKSMTGVASVMPIQKSNDKISMNLIPTDEVLICGKKCIVLGFENKNFKYKIWLTNEEDEYIVKSAFNDLNILLNIEQLGELSSLIITNQVWMKIVVENVKTKKTDVFEMTKYYSLIDESIMTFDYKFITPKWD